jgi:hypothetical protein
MSSSNVLIQGGTGSAQTRSRPNVHGTKSLVQKFLAGGQKQPPLFMRFARLLITSGEYRLNPEKALEFFAEEPDVKRMAGKSPQTGALREAANDFIRHAPEGWQTLLKKGVVAPRSGNFFNDPVAAGAALSIIADNAGGAEKITWEAIRLCHLDKPLIRLAGGNCGMEGAMKRIPELIALAGQAPKSQPLFFDPALPLHHAVIKGAVLADKFVIDASEETFACLQGFAPLGETIIFYNRGPPKSRERLRDIVKSMAESGEPEHLEELYRLYWAGRFKPMIDYRHPENRALARQAWRGAMGEKLPTQYECRYYLLPKLFSTNAKRPSEQCRQAALPGAPQNASGKASPFFSSSLKLENKPAAKPGPENRPAKAHKKPGKPGKRQDAAGEKAAPEGISREAIHKLALEKLLGERRKEFLAAKKAQAVKPIGIESKLQDLDWSPSMETPENYKNAQLDPHGTANKIKLYCYYKFLQAAADIDVEAYVSVPSDPTRPHHWESRPGRGEHEFSIVIHYDGAYSACRHSFKNNNEAFDIRELDAVIGNMAKKAMAGKAARPV